MIIRKFEQEDARYVAELINRNYFEDNIKNYTKEELKFRSFNEEKIRLVAGNAHMLVCSIDNQIVGCGAISSYWNSFGENVLLSIFVKPELYKKGIGKSIIEALEKEELYQHAKRIEIPSSKTAFELYLKMGYNHIEG